MANKMITTEISSNKYLDNTAGNAEEVSEEKVNENNEKKPRKRL